MRTCKQCGIKHDGERCPVCKWMKADKPKKVKKPKQRTRPCDIRSMVRKLWMWSPERRAALKMYDNHCAECGVKASKSKSHPVVLEVHHVEPIAKAVEEIIRLFFAHILVPPDKLRPLCPSCHALEHEKAVDITDAEVLSCAATKEETTNA